MAKIKIRLDHTLLNGEAITFEAPCNCTAVDGISVTYPVEIEDGSLAEEVAEFGFRDAHNNDVAGIGNLFAAGATVKAILNTVDHGAYLQNADTNAYLEARFRTIKEELAVFDTPGEHSWVCPDDVSVVEVLMAGGGQGGGYEYGGNGGEVIVKTLHVTPGESYLFSVGAGGAGASVLQGAGAGENTTAFGFTARGGDRGNEIGAHGGLRTNESSIDPAPGQNGVFNEYDSFYYGCGGGGKAVGYDPGLPGGLAHQTRGRGGYGGCQDKSAAGDGQVGGGGGGAGYSYYDESQVHLKTGNGGCGIIILYAGVPPFPSGGIATYNGGDEPVGDGVVYVPTVSSEGVISWSNNGGLDNPTPVDLVAAVIAALPLYNGEVVTE